MSGGNLRALPANIAIGRSNWGGPVTGGMVVLHGYAQSVPTGQNDGDFIIGAHILPFNARLQGISVYYRAVTTASATLKVYRNPTVVSLTGATSILSPTYGAGTVTGYFYGPVGADGINTSTACAAPANREFSRGTRIFTTLTTTTGTVSDICVQYFFSCSGFAVSDPAND